MTLLIFSGDFQLLETPSPETVSLSGDFRLRDLDPATQAIFSGQFKLMAGDPTIFAWNPDADRWYPSPQATWTADGWLPQP